MSKIQDYHFTEDWDVQERIQALQYMRDIRLMGRCTLSVLRNTASHKAQIIEMQKEKSFGTAAVIMPKVKDITKRQFFRIYSVLNDNKEMTSSEISEHLGMPLPSVRRILGDLFMAGKIEKKFIYRLK